MTDPAKTGTDKDTPAAGAKAMTAARAAGLVKRPVTEKDAEGNLVTKLAKVGADEVLSFKDYGTHVVVVTKDGQKFSSAEAAA